MRATLVVSFLALAGLSSLAQADDALPMKSGPAPAAVAPVAITPAAGTPSAAPSVPEPLPDGRVLLKKFIDACGGSGSFAKVTNIELKGTLSIPSQQMSGSVVIYQDKPNKVLAITELGPITMQQGFNGEVGWASDPIQGPRLLQGAELEQLKSSGGEIEVFGYANPDEYFTKAQTLERTTFEGKDAYKVALATKGGEEIIAYFDPATTLQLGMETKVNSIMGEVPVSVSLSDWRDFSGMKVPTKMTQSMMGMKAFTTIESMKFNLAELPSFSPPAEVLQAQE